MEINEAIKFLKENNQDFKVEIAEDLKNEWETKLSFYKSWNFTDLCAWPHVEHTWKIKNFKLTNISASYFRWDSSKPIMQRVYWVCFETKEELQDYEKMLIEAKKRDHRVLWKKLWLFTFSDKVWACLPLFTVKWTKLEMQ
jgi:threonyl-tRNA synthetase